MVDDMDGKDFKPGDMVLVGGVTEAVIVWESDPLPCMMCGDDGCKEWANLLTIDGKWLFHVSEHDMDFSKFGYKLRPNAR